MLAAHKHDCCWRLGDYLKDGEKEKIKIIFKNPNHKMLVIANCSGEMFAVLLNYSVLFIRYLYIDIFKQTLSHSTEKN